MAPILLMYHYIGHPPGNARIHGLFATPGQLEWQLRLLIKQGFNFTTFLETGNDRYLKLPEKTVIITFDDGSDTILKQAFPILKKLGIPAVVFPVTGFIGQSNKLMAGSANNVPVSFLTREEIRFLSDEGMEIGSHMHTHTAADQLSDASLVRELDHSKKILEEITGKPVITLAYPYGIFDLRTVEEAKKAGYKFGMTTNKPPLSNDPLMQLQRFSVKGTRWHHPVHFLKNSFNRFRKG